MVFSSVFFLFIFLPITLIVYYVLRGEAKNYWLLMMSMVFFSWSQPQYAVLIIISILINYVGGLFIGRTSSHLLSRTTLMLVLLLNLGILFYYKYYNFAVHTISILLQRQSAVKTIILPIGISFFTFQGMSYVIDVYRKRVLPQNNIAKVGLYIVLFPQLIAGPIIRYQDIAIEIDRRSVSLSDFCVGIERFILGLSKKAIIANSMAVTADAIWSNAEFGNLTAVAWLGSVAYTLQIYYDFSGYSDMAIGLGRMFGFHFNENFNLPYISQSITEFWRRWHISLSSWFKDYVYIPLGGNRKHVYRNLIIVFFLTGLWHGASWNFILWGMINGVLIVLERVWRTIRNKMQTDEKTIAVRAWGHIYTLFVVNIGWVLFRAPTLQTARQYLNCMFGSFVPLTPGFDLWWYLDRWTVTIMVLGIIFASDIPGRVIRLIFQRDRTWKLCLKYFTLLFLFVLSIFRIVAGTYNPFIYFQF